LRVISCSGVSLKSILEPPASQKTDSEIYLC